MSKRGGLADFYSRSVHYEHTTLIVLEDNRKWESLSYKSRAIYGIPERGQDEIVLRYCTLMEGRLDVYVALEKTKTLLLRCFSVPMHARDFQISAIPEEVADQIEVAVNMWFLGRKR